MYTVIFKFNLIKSRVRIVDWVIIGSDRRPETKQGIKGKIVSFRSGRVGDIRVRDN